MNELQVQHKSVNEMGDCVEEREGQCVGASKLGKLNPTPKWPGR